MRQEPETLSNQLWEQILANRELERKVIWLEESLDATKEQYKDHVEKLQDENRAKDDTIGALRLQVEDMGHDMSALESRIAKCMDEYVPATPHCV